MRRALSAAERTEVLKKTGRRCHICGGAIRRNDSWAADHILAFAHGGKHDVNNFLPAHSECNGYRRHLTPEELAWVLKLGVWMRGQIDRQDPAALEIADRFAMHHTRLHQRRAPV